MYVAVTHHWPGMFKDAMSDPVFKTIQEEFKLHRPDAVIIEGVDPSDMSGFLAHIKECASSNYEMPNSFCGEPAFAAHLAQECGADIYTGEPDRARVLSFFDSHGYTIRDFLAYQVMLDISNHDRSKPVPPDVLRNVIARRVAYENKLLGRTKRFTVADFTAWYAEHIQKGEVTAKDISPSPQIGPPQSEINTLSGLHTMIRDQYVVTAISLALKTHRSLIVVYGSGHLQFEWKDLVNMFGRPTESKPF